MRGRFIHQAVLGILLICQFSACLGTETSDPNDGSKYLDAVREFADNVLRYGRDTYGPKRTPLFADGLNVNNLKPVEWIDPDGTKWIPSNFASQQTFLRTLDGLSSITGDAKYRHAATEAIRYMFDHLRTPNGLPYWGHLATYDASADKVWGKSHVFKLHYPYYELMWKVDPKATKKFIEAFWSAHIFDWSNLDFNRIARFDQRFEEPWNHEYDEDSPTFFRSKHGGGGFLLTGTSLVHAGTTLHRLTGEEPPLVWSERLIRRFIDTRHPKTGIGSLIYNNPWFQLGEDMKEHFADPHTTIFPFNPFEFRYFEYPQDTGAVLEAFPWMSIFLVGKILGEEGKEFTQWSLEEFTAWGKVSYRKRDNSFVPMLTDGTNLEGYVWRLNVAKPYPADPSFFWVYSVAYRTTGDEFMWEMVRDIVLGNDFGDIGETPAHTPELQTNTTFSHAYGVFGFLELYAKTKNPAYLEMARRIGDNILSSQFHKGFFVPSKRHIYTRFDCFEPLALLHLEAAMKSKIGSVPRVWPSVPLFVPPYRYKQHGVDLRVIYALTESPEPPLSLQEAAAIGDVELVRSLLDKGVGVDSWDDSRKKTALQRAAISGHKDVVELLLAKENGHKEIAELLIAKGADVNAIRRAGGDTPLHSAAMVGHKDIVELLIANGADVNAKNNKGQTPVDIAASRNRSKVVKLLIEKGADVSLDVAARVGALAKVKSLIEEGVDINRKNRIVLCGEDWP